MRGVAFLPEEFSSSQEHARAHFPPHDVGPLVKQQRQIPVGGDPFGHHLADDGFRGRPDDERLFQFLAAGVGNDGEFGREALDVRCLAPEVRLRNQQREIGIVVPGVFDPAIQLSLEKFPDAVAIRSDDHRALDRTPVDQLRLGDKLVVPSRKILFLGRHSVITAWHAPRIPGWVGDWHGRARGNGRQRPPEGRAVSCRGGRCR